MLNAKKFGLQGILIYEHLDMYAMICKDFAVSYVQISL